VIKSDKKIKELSAVLKKNDTVAVAHAVNLLRDDEPFEGAISLMAEYYDNCTDKSLQKTIEAFFNDLKDQSVRPEIIAEIRKPWKHDTISMLVASCWQSGLDYSDYLTDLALTFLRADYATSIECMTVIEESVQNSSRARKDEAIALIMGDPASFMNEKNSLVHELIGILQK
jgi:hypothetical protein